MNPIEISSISYKGNPTPIEYANLLQEFASEGVLIVFINKLLSELNRRKPRNQKKVLVYLDELLCKNKECTYDRVRCDKWHDFSSEIK